MSDVNPETISPEDATATEPASSTDTTAPDSAVVSGTNSEMADPTTAPASDAGEEEPTEENTAPDADVGDADSVEPSATDAFTAPVDTGAPPAFASEEAASDTEGKSDDNADASPSEDGASEQTTPARDDDAETADNADAPVLTSDAGDAPSVQGAPAIPQATAYQPDSDQGDGSKIATDPNAGPGPIDPSVSGGGNLGNVPSNVPNVPVTEDINGDGKDTNPGIADGTNKGSDEDASDEDDFAPGFGGGEEEDSEDDDEDESAAGIDTDDECIFGEPKQLVATIVDLLEDEAIELYKKSGEHAVKALRFLGDMPTDTLGSADKELLGNMQNALQEHVKHVLAFFHMAD